MAKHQPPRRLHEALRVTGALVATLPPAVLAAVCLARWVPGDAELRFMLGLTLAIPFWVLAACRAFLAHGGGRVWLCSGIAALVFGGLAYGGMP